MANGDQIIDRAADWLEAQAERQRAAGGDGWKGKLADELVEDAAFLRKLKPSLVQARAKGQAPTDEEPEAATTHVTAPPPAPRPKRAARAKRSGSGGGPNPFVVAGAALAVGILLAKIVDWRGHAHPRD